VIPGDHPVIQTEYQVGNRKVIVSRDREPLEHRTPIVSDVPGQTSLKGRQSGDRLCHVTRQIRAGRAQCVTRDPAPGGVLPPSYLGRGTFTPDDEDGVGGEKGVLGVGVLRGRAVEEQQVGKIEKAGADFGGIRRFGQRLDQRRKATTHSLLVRLPRFPAAPLPRRFDR
jgi:hypothetical protein